MAIGAACSSIRDDLPMRIRERRAVTASGVLLGWLTVAAGGCGSDAKREEPAPNAVAEVRDAALRTLGAGPATIRIGVTSATAKYSVGGTMEVATDRFRVRARVSRAPMTHFDRVIDVVGVGRETYEIGRGDPGFDNIGTSCWLDPHQAIGSLGGAASVQEAVALAGVAVRLLRDGTRTATLVGDHADGATTYRITTDPSKASVAPSARGGDEVVVVDPIRLARHLAPIRVRVTSDCLVRRLALELRRFRPPSRGPGRRREHRRERVSVTLSFSDFGRKLDLPEPPCVAME